MNQRKRERGKIGSKEGKKVTFFQKKKKKKGTLTGEDH